jgi:hypothetical protein
MGLLFFLVACVVDPASSDFSCLAEKRDGRELSVVSNALLHG